MEEWHCLLLGGVHRRGSTLGRGDFELTCGLGVLEGLPSAITSTRQFGAGERSGLLGYIGTPHFATEFCSYN